MFGTGRLCKRGGLALLVTAGITAIAAPLPVQAADPLKDFKAVYQAYEREMAGRHYANAIPYAEQALEMARKSGSFGQSYLRTLTANLGRMYFMVGRWADAERAFKHYLATPHEQGSSIDEYLVVLLQAGTAKRELGKPAEAIPLFRRLLEYVGRRDKARRPMRADALNQLTLVLLELKQADKALDAGEEAYELYEDLHGRKDVRTLEAGLTLARTEVLLLKNDGARDHLERTAESLHENPKLRDWQKAGLHGRIAALYEKMESNSNADWHRSKAEAFLRGIGDVELELRNQVAPEYPPRAAREGVAGFVEVQFTVAKSGRISELRIVRASPPGVFDDAVIKALKEWRFKPPKQDGIRVDYPGVRKSIEFRTPD